MFDIISKFEEKLGFLNKNPCLDSKQVLETLCILSVKHVTYINDISLAGDDEQDGVYTYPNGGNEEYRLDVYSNGSAVIQSISAHGIVRALQTFLQVFIKFGNFLQCS
jgi:hypothetical protein